MRVVAGALGRVHVHARVCSLAYPAFNAYAPYCDVICCPSGSTMFLDIIINGAVFGKKLLNVKCVLIFSTTFI
jgi:hypothetical protein